MMLAKVFPSILFFYYWQLLWPGADFPGKAKDLPKK
jgi:hypothetical protein